jgi:hypothetical protein
MNLIWKVITLALLLLIGMVSTIAIQIYTTNDQILFNKSLSGLLCSYDACIYQDSENTYYINSLGGIKSQVAKTEYNDGIPIQDAVNNLSSGTIYIDSGTYTIQVPTLRHSGILLHYYTGLFINGSTKNLIIRGNGPGNTILKLAGADTLGDGNYSHYLNHPALIMLNSVENGTSTPGYRSFTLSNITFDGNSANQQYYSSITPGYNDTIGNIDGSGLFLSGAPRYNGIYSNLEFKNSTCSGMYLGYNAGGYEHYVTVRDIYAHDNMYRSIQFDSMRDSIVSNITVINGSTQELVPFGLVINGNGGLNYHQYPKLNGTYNNIFLINNSMTIDYAHGVSVSEVNISSSNTNGHGIEVLYGDMIKLNNFTVTTNRSGDIFGLSTYFYNTSNIYLTNSTLNGSVTLYLDTKTRATVNNSTLDANNSFAYLTGDSTLGLYNSKIITTKNISQVSPGNTLDLSGNIFFNIENTTIARENL